MSRNVDTGDKVVTMSYKWKCRIQTWKEKEYNDFVYSPSFMVAHNGVYHEFCVSAGPAGFTGHDGHQYKKHMAMFIENLSDLASSIKFKVVAMYSTDQDSQHKAIAMPDTFGEVPSGKGCGNCEAIKLVKEGGIGVLPFNGNTVTFHIICSFPESIFNVDDYLPNPLVLSDDSTLTGLHELTLTNPRHPTVDLTLVCEDGVVHVHRGILMLVSAVFKNLFNSDMKKDAQADEIKAGTLNSQAVKELVRFAYLKAPSAAIQQDQLVVDVLKAAHMYMVEQLIGECERVMVKRVLHDAQMYAVDYYCLAVFYKLKTLENVCTVALLEYWDELGVADDGKLDEHRKALVNKLAKYSRSNVISVM